MRVASVALAYTLLCVGLWAVPLLRVLHAESSAVVAGVAFLVAGLSALRGFRRGRTFAPVLRLHLLLLLVPWALLTFTLLWTPNRGYAQGLLLFVAFAPPSVAASVALAYALSGARLRFPLLAFLGLTAAVLVVTPLFDLGLHPQFYHYNHVFGGVLGPIYDEELALRPGLFAFRGLTLLWAAVLYLAGEAGRGRRAPQRLWTVLGLVALTYGLGGWLGINTPRWRLRQALPARVQTAHFDIHFDPARLEKDAVQRIARQHEWRYAQLRDTLGVAPTERVQSYLYPDARTRARLTGTGYTSVAPVWLSDPQMHLLQARLDRVLGHELVHVFSRAFGLPVVHASRHVGLVEGLAVALEPPDGLPGADAQVSAAALSSADTLLADRLAASLGGEGFWTARGAVSYTTTGSFVGYLLRQYGVRRFREAYPWGDFRRAYGRSARELAEEWETALQHLDYVDLAAAPLARQRFSAPSLFEQSSPHWVPPAVRLTRRADRWSALGDTARALGALEGALRRQPAYAPALERWARILLANGNPARVVARLDTVDLDTPVLFVRRGDARAWMGQGGAARGDYDAALAMTPAYAHATASAIYLHRALAHRPQAVAGLYGAAPPDTSVAAEVLAALARLEADPAQAYRELARGSGSPLGSEAPGVRNRFAGQRLVWMAEAALDAGWYGLAATHAYQAGRLFDALGDRSTVRYLHDLAAQARWAERTSLPFP